MVLIDTGPLVLLIDKKHPKHQFCCQTLSDLPKPFMTTWICLAEAMYLAYRKGGWVMQNQLSKLLTEGLLVIFDIQQKDYNRLFHLMEKYRDTPMDFADATLVLAAENLKGTSKKRIAWPINQKIGSSNFNEEHPHSDD
jgi:uncharacterized protein